MPLADLGDPRYISLRTFRKTGVAVDTPVWAASGGGGLVVWTSSASGKCKRIRNNGDVEVAPCDMRGRVKGPWVPATARLAVGADEVAHGEALIARKYGWQFKLTRLTSRDRKNDAIIVIADRG